MALVVLTDTSQKFNDVDVSEVKVVPVPASVTVCGLLLELLVTVSVAGCAPSETGLKLTPIEQVAPAAKDGVKHVEEGEMEYALPTVTDNEEIVRDVDW
jgi:hypothetical protein